MSDLTGSPVFLSLNLAALIRIEQKISQEASQHRSKCCFRCPCGRARGHTRVASLTEDWSVKATVTGGWVKCQTTTEALTAPDV